MAAAAMVEGGRLEDGYGLLLEETELRLGPPGGDAEPVKSGGKRDFSQTVDLKLKLAASLSHGGDSDDWKAKNELLNQVENHEKAPANKALVVGWPPVRSFRKNIFSELQTRPRKKEEEEKLMGGAMLVKVSMDGAPYLRKVDLKNYKSYKDLSAALETMFRSFTSGNCSSNVKDFMKENKLNCSEYVPTYEDKDGDWMLVGDVPWEMFVVSCRRLRIVHCSEAVGLAPRTAEKHKSGAER